MALNENLQKSEQEGKAIFPKAPSALKTPAAYHEIGGHHQPKDLLQQLKANLQQLEDLEGRMQFMMSEIRGLTRSR